MIFSVLGVAVKFIDYSIHSYHALHFLATFRTEAKGIRSTQDPAVYKRQIS